MAFSSVEEALKAEGRPDLVLLLANKNPKSYRSDLASLNNDIAFSSIPRISIFPFDFPEQESTAGKGEAASGPAFSLPVDRLKFLSELAGVLKIPTRRVFEILIGIQPEGSGLKYSGKSLDFSETGMAFECDTDLEGGGKVIVSFVNPKSRKRVLLNAEIVRKRSTPSGPQTIYGVRFIKMTGQNIEDLTNFIRGKS